ncbi:MAG: dihydrofolate reductase family protein [Pseudonocardiales bacterium]|nr:dihydrofolate reductase family protein [Actinomycetota bacterium]
MSKVIIGMSMSLDGIASGTTEANFWDVHNAVLGWLFDLQTWRSAAAMDGGEDNADSRLWAEENERIGAQVLGRRMFDFGNESWGEEPPFRAPVFVLTHRPQERIGKQGGTSYTFVTDGIAAAVEAAKAAAGGKDVLLAGGLSIAQQALAAGVVDELAVHVRSVLIGHGARLFDAIGAEHIHLERTHISGSTGVTHLRYSVIPTHGTANPGESS